MLKTIVDPRNSMSGVLPWRFVSFRVCAPTVVTSLFTRLNKTNLTSGLLDVFSTRRENMACIAHLVVFLLIDVGTLEEKLLRCRDDISAKWYFLVFLCYAPFFGERPRAAPTANTSSQRLTRPWNPIFRDSIRPVVRLNFIKKLFLIWSYSHHRLFSLTILSPRSAKLKIVPINLGSLLHSLLDMHRSRLTPKDKTNRLLLRLPKCHKATNRVIGQFPSHIQAWGKNMSPTVTSRLDVKTGAWARYTSKSKDSALHGCSSSITTTINSKQRARAVPPIQSTHSTNTALTCWDFHDIARRR